MAHLGKARGLVIATLHVDGVNRNVVGVNTKVVTVNT
jgi:hypothetical protein